MNLLKTYLNKIIKNLKLVWQKFLSLTLLKKVIILIIIIAVLFGGYKLYETKFRVESPTYQTSLAEKGTLISSVTTSGSISSGSNVEITTQVGGVVNKVYIKSGDYVVKGQEIATITLDQNSAQKSAAAYASYLSAQNNLNSANAKTNSLQSTLFKANQAFVNGAGSSSDPDTADPTYIQQRADWLQAEADYNNQQGVINAANASLTSTSLSHAQLSPTITAPTDGVITNLNLTEGLQIITTTSDSSSNTNSSQSVGTIKTNSSNLQASVNLTEIDATKVEVGQKVTLTLDAFPDMTFTGKVSSIDTSGSVDSGVTTYPAIITFDTDPENIYPNMGVTATIITSVKSDVIMIPSSAVQTSNDTSLVRVLKDGEITSVEVETGESNDTQIEIVSGLNEGDTVVLGITTTDSSNSSSSPFGNSGFGGAMRATTGSGPRPN